MPNLSEQRRTPLGLIYSAESTSGRRWHELPLSAAGSDIHLFDLTPNDRFGLKGRGASAWLKSMGLPVPDEINRSEQTSQGLDIVRLGSEDIVIVDSFNRASPSLTTLRKDWESDTAQPKGFNSWRDEVWAWSHLSGAGASDLMAKTCPVDLDPQRFGQFNVAQTRVAHMDCIVVRSDRLATPGFDLFFDIASSEYMAEALKDLSAGPQAEFQHSGREGLASSNRDLLHDFGV